MKETPPPSSGASRRQFIRTAVVTAAGGLLSNVVARGQAPAVIRSEKSRRPNIIYMVVHDLGKHCSVHGVPVPTPTLEGLAAEGIACDSAFCTSPPCSPSRGCAMTGHLPHRNQLMGLVNHGWRLADEPPNMVDVMNANGYVTASAGFTHERHGGADEMHYQRVLKHRKSMADNFIENALDDAIGFMDSRSKGDAPFYLNIGTMETHGSQWKPDGYYEEHFGRGAKKFGIDRVEDTYIPPQMSASEYSYEMMRRFAPCVRYMDSQLARLVEAIQQMDDAENTLFVFTTDHGILSSRGKGTAYDHGMEITNIFYQPGRLAAGKRFPHLVNNVDLFPTLLDCAGVPAPENFGHSHWSGLTGEREYTPQEYIFTERNYHENYDPVRAIRTDRYHYLRNFHPFAKKYPTAAEIMASDDRNIRDRWPAETTLAGPDHSSASLAKYPDRDKEELYDIVNDPYETHNLAYDPEFAGVRERLAACCEQEMVRTRDPLLAGPIPPTPEQYELIKGRTGKTVGPPLEQTLGLA
ncbi:sulfatase-like hydrolase/transferase [Ruficoccus amylovorans]|nr:sulfatase-like hydrolase/transferase [Ruficoccus amylovorans]